MTEYRHTKALTADQGNCYGNAREQEPLFTLLGRDRHGAALVELWAFMREKEGEPAERVADAREAAEEMRAYGQSLGKPVLTLDALITLSASLVHQREAERIDKARVAALPNPVQEGDLVTAAGRVFSGHVGRVSRIFADDAEPAALRGQVNVTFGRTPADRTLTMARAAVRLATDAEVQAAGITR